MHFDIAGVLGPVPPSGVVCFGDEVTHSLEHQNLRVESAVPGHHALLLEHQRSASGFSEGHSSDDEERLVPRPRGNSTDLREPLLPTVQEMPT
jgi:hypothetical protein